MKKLLFFFLIATSLTAQAGYEIVCKNFHPSFNTKTKVAIDCKNIDAVKNALRKGDSDIRSYFAKEANLPPQKRSYQVRDDEKMSCWRAVHELNSPNMKYPGMYSQNIAPSIMASCNSTLSRIK